MENLLNFIRSRVDMNEVRSTIEHMKEYSLCFLFANNILYGKVNDIIDEYILY